MSYSITIKRVYEAPEESDGYRILIDRLWPRGIKKESANLTEWLKDIAPSNELRKWFNHEPEKFVEFSKRYREELKQHTEDLKRIAKLVQSQKVTLLFGAKNETQNQAVVVQQVLKEIKV